MKSFKKALLLFFLISFSNLSFSQNLNDFISGVLLDAATGEPVVFATIRVKNKAIGVISNNDGGFKVPIHFQLEGEALEISCMGYQTKTVVFSELKERTINRIYLQPSTFELSETVVTATKKKRPTARQIIKRALQQIPDNYQNDNFELVGYYRDYQLKNKDYLNLNEALIKVLDEGFHIEDYQTLKFGLYEYIQNQEFERDSFAAKPYDYSNRDKIIPDATLQGNYVGNELVLLFIHDAIRNHKIDAYSFVYQFVEDFIKEHRFKRLENTTFGDELVYKIQISKSVIPYKVNGIIYVDVDDYSIRKLDYSVWKLKPIESSPYKYSSTKKDLLYEILVEYQDVGDNMFLNYISFHNQFKLVRPPKFFIESVDIESDKRLFDVIFNKPPSDWRKLEIEDFKLYYQNERLDIYRVDSIAPNKLRILFPNEELKQRRVRNLLFSKIEDVEKKSLILNFKKLKDSAGNILGERKIEFLEQFREFFAQRVETNPTANPDNIWVDKNKSLSHANQPIFPKDVSLDGLWMNTPLKSIK